VTAGKPSREKARYSGYRAGSLTNEAERRAADFRKNRLPKYLGYFELVLERNPAGDRHLAGGALSYADLSLFQVIAGLDIAFPRAMRRLSRRHTRLRTLHDHVAARPRIAAYLASDRRIAFNQEGIFRHYPGLDG
jgi:glutathione S-transferase